MAVPNYVNICRLMYHHQQYKCYPPPLQRCLLADFEATPDLAEVNLLVHSNIRQICLILIYLTVLNIEISLLSAAVFLTI